MDNSWRDLEEPWERTKWARSQRFESAAAAAAAMDMQDGTYRGYERGPEASKYIKLDYRKAVQFGRTFKVRWEWLLDGAGEPWLTRPADRAPEEAAERVPNTIRAWREFRGLTVAQLARKSGLSAQSIADLESGARETSDKLLHQLADVLAVGPGLLLNTTPADRTAEFLDTIAHIPEERRSQALAILNTFRERSSKR